MRNVSYDKIWLPTREQDCLLQLKELCETAYPLEIGLYANKRGFQGERKQGATSGVLSITARLNHEGHIEFEIEIFKGIHKALVSTRELFEILNNLRSQVVIKESGSGDDGKFTLLVKMQVTASPLSVARSNGLLSELERIDNLAEILQADAFPQVQNLNLDEIFGDYRDVLLPVEPFETDLTENNDEISKWLEQTKDFLYACCPIAVTSPYQVSREFILAAFAGTATRKEEALGYYLPPAIDPSGLLKLVKKCPGILVVPALCLRSGNPYEMHDEIKNTLSTLTSLGKPVIFVGSKEEQQGIFGGGQGTIADPLSPIVRDIPDIKLDSLIRFKVRKEAKARKGVVRSSLAPLTDDIKKNLDQCSIHDQLRLLPKVVHYYLKTYEKNNHQQTNQDFSRQLRTLTETFGGLQVTPRVKRLPEVQKHFKAVLTSSDLLSHLKKHLIAQDRALEQLCIRLATEVLTRPLHQPIRFCSQGTPGTGKSESLALIAELMGIPYVNIDAASMPNFSFASSQLLGSGRGYVMSNKPGRLEQVARHHTGALVEVSDLDHADPSVRSGLADLFLQVLETGEAQTSTGSMFSCANVIIAFTMNLPGGADEAVRKGFGFTPAPAREEVTHRVVSEIKTMLSTAFLSRVGTPILFDPLNSEAMGLILERSISRALKAAVAQLDVTVSEISPEPDLGGKLLELKYRSLTSFGARGLLEEGRSMAATALLNFLEKNPNVDQTALGVSANIKDGLTLQVISPPS